MEANTPVIFLKGMDKIIKKDLQKHKDLKDRCKQTLDAYRTAVSHQVKKKKHYSSLLGGGKYNDDSLRESISMIGTDLRHMSDKVKLTEEEIAHHTLIVDTLTEQLEQYYRTKSDRDEYLAHANSH